MKKITDQFGRVHDYLRLSLTDKCNLRCVYCMPEEGILYEPHAALMQLNEIREIVSLLVDMGVQKIKITGGEPMVRKDFPEILSMLSEFPVELGITTNGILLDQHIDALKEAGIDSLNISLDTLDQNKFQKITRRHSYEKVRENIGLALQKGFKIKLNSVLLKGLNDDEVLDFIELSRVQPLDVRFIEYMPFNGNRWEFEKVVSFDDILEQAKTRYKFKVLDNHFNSTSRNFKINGGKGSFGIISSISNPFCEGCNRIRLTADGKIKNCLFSTAETDLLTPLRQNTPLEDLIRKAIFEKHFSRGGLHNFEMKEAADEYAQNRSMISIGG